MHDVSKALRDHYEGTFKAHGANSLGVDWGSDPAKLALRYDKMLDVLPPHGEGVPSLLDVGCGYGGLLVHARSLGRSIDYTGIDVAASMIDWARGNIDGATFIAGDILDDNAALAPAYDYVVCNGVLTQKLDTPGSEMDVFAGALIKRMFAKCRHGIAFNVMTTKVNFFANNLYYRNPAELLGWCMSEVSPHVRIDHAYPLFEYTTYIYKSPR